MRPEDANAKAAGSDQNEGQIPESLRNALRRRYGGTPEISEEQDARILATSLSKLNEASSETRTAKTLVRQNRPGRWILASVTAAAAAMVLLTVMQRRQTDEGSGLLVKQEQTQIGTAEQQLSGYLASADNMSAKLSSQNQVGVLPDDIDQDGRVDILDAFAMARRISKGDRGTVWDRNQDGQVDQQDVDLLAQLTVTL